MSVADSQAQGSLSRVLVPAHAIHPMRATAMMRINAVWIFLSDMSEGASHVPPAGVNSVRLPWIHAWATSMVRGSIPEGASSFSLWISYRTT
jgi:hypothetical protein